MEWGLSTTLSVTDLQTVDGAEPRLRDLRLAEALGFEKTHNVRKLIERHQAALIRLGEVFSTVEKTSPAGGRPAPTYWLNKKQALYLCTKSEAPLATEVTLQMVEVFDAWLDRQRMPAEAEAPALPPPGELRLWLRMVGEYRQALGPAAAAWLIRRLPLPYPPAEALAHDGLALADPAEGEACLRHLAAHPLGGVTVGAAIGRVTASPVAEAFLARRLATFGVVVSPAGGRGQLAVANGGDGLGLDAAFAGSPWAGRRWRFALRTLPGARAAVSTIAFADARNGLRATLIPLAVALPLAAPASAPTGGTEHG